MKHGNGYDLHSRFDEHVFASPSRTESIRPWASIGGGAAMAAFGVFRKSWPGAALAAAGGFLVYQGFRESHRAARPIHVEKSFTINRPVDEVFRYWRNFENLPKFMRHLRSVQPTGDRTSRWEVRSPIGTVIGWDAEITDERENDYILWRSLAGGTVEHRGSIEFRRTPFDGATEVAVSLDYRPPAGKLGSVFARLFGENPEQQVREDLRRFKQLMEAGEIPTTRGQSSGRRSAFVRMTHAANADRSTVEERTAV
jgi:uncharacterized membrane protein